LAINQNYLFDTNIFLEIFLSQENSELSKSLINNKNLNTIFISDFSLHSVGVILSRKNKSEMFEAFIDDILMSNKFKVLSVSIDKMPNIIKNINLHNLDFDDAYQLTISTIYNLGIVTYDKDFNKIDINSISPFNLSNLLNNYQ